MDLDIADITDAMVLWRLGVECLRLGQKCLNTFARARLRTERHVNEAFEEAFEEARRT